MKQLVPKNKIPVGVLGATGLVGQNYVRLLAHHPWFELRHVAASPQSAGQTYAAAVAGRWQYSQDFPTGAERLTVAEAADIAAAKQKCRLVFSAVELGSKEAVQKMEKQYAAAGLAVVSNASAHRNTPNVPVIMPEVNSQHLDIIAAQRRHYGWGTGCLITKPNCSLQSYLLPLVALIRAGYEIKKIFVTTLQALSGAGYPGVPALDMVDNIIPFIADEEAKTEFEPLKILGRIVGNKILPAREPIISAQCTRVPVRDGHTACVSVLFGNKKPNQKQILKIWRAFTAEPQKLKLPSAPPHPIIYRSEKNRPQPVKDRDAERGMATVVGRLRPCPILDFKFVALSHNTVRGAAGGGILSAELLVAKSFVN